MGDNINNNPFAGLFSSINDAVSFSLQNQASFSEDDNYLVRSTDDNDQDDGTDQDDTNESSESHEFKITKTDDQVKFLLEHVFGITLENVETDEWHESRLVFINDDSVEQVVFERLLILDPESKLVPRKNTKGISCDPHFIEKRVMHYLFKSYCRLKWYPRRFKFSESLERMRQIILQNAGTALQEPDLFEGQEIHNQFIELFMDESVQKQELSSFTNSIVAELQRNKDENGVDIIAASFTPILDRIHNEVAHSNLIIRQYWFSILLLYSSIEPLAKLVINHNKPKGNQGRAYADTLLGSLFNLSCLPKTVEDTFEFFDKPLQDSTTALEGNIWTALNTLSELLHSVFHLLLKCSSEVRNLTLQWIGDCLDTNSSRGKLWNTQNDMGFGALLCVSDGFMLNLGNVLLLLSKPFCTFETKIKFPKIDPTYCAAEIEDENDMSNKGVHLKGISKETCLVPIPENDIRPVSKTFAFTTECFFLTHRALDLGYRVVFDKLLRTNQDLARIQRVFNDSRTGGSSEVQEAITRHMEIEMTKYLSLRASLLVPQMLKLLAKFHATTASWLTQVACTTDTNVGEDEQIDYVPKEYKPITFPLPEDVPETLKCIPEFVVENTITYLCFLRRLSSHVFEEQGKEFMNPVLTEIIALMESRRRLYNPHLRARLAEGLEALLPTADETDAPVAINLGSFHREQLFITHPFKQYIVANLIEVFVSVEMTGQSVQFEQKFNYRRPMYVVMEYLWKIPEHRNNFVILAKEAEDNMEDARPPLFLRFINLLINDSVYLLEEGLSNMAQLRQMIQARENGDWNKLPQHERNQQASYLQHIGMLARFDNILGRKTIQTLKMLTSEIKSIFCHTTMVDRIALMLNYLLLQLVGPNKKNLKVNDQKEYAFNPANLVLNICEIYINLSESESFTFAVSQDGRSYSPELFKLAENVLVRIGGAGILGYLDQFAKSVEAAVHQKKEEDEALNEAPDEFLDPIMSTIMTDPVMLPSSKTVVDRQTIARHLLSDQTDPFNRSPLTMDMVKADLDLQRRIQEWMEEKKKEKATTNLQ